MATSRVPGKKVSVKHLQINKSQSNMLIVIALTVAFVIFGLFATKALISKGLYQRRALHAQRDVVSQLKTNYNNAQTLFTQYKVFANGDPNVLDGHLTGTANNDGDNAKIVLDALPSTYDAPALATSLDNIMQMSVEMTTYYQPAKSLDLAATKEVK
jgi:hypothetical protein